MKKGDNEAAEIRYVNIVENKEGLEELEVQGKFLVDWVGKRLVDEQIATKDNTQNNIYRIVRENVINPKNPARKIPNIFFNPNDTDIGSGVVDYISEYKINALLGVEDAAKAAKIGFRLITDVRQKKHYFSVYAGQNLTSEQSVNPPCVFSKEFDNILEQEFTNSVENYKSTAYIGGEETEPRTVVEVGGSAVGLSRNEVFINATDVTRKYTENEVEIIRPEAEYLALLESRGISELEQYAETLKFSNKINQYANLKYKEDFDLGDRVTCINKRWGVKINVRITEIAEIYQQNGNEVEITFGESLPALLDKIRQITKAG